MSSWPWLTPTAALRFVPRSCVRKRCAPPSCTPERSRPLRRARPRFESSNLTPASFALVKFARASSAFDMSAPERSAPVKSDRFTSDFVKLAPASSAWTKSERLVCAVVKFAFSSFALVKFARHATALVKSAPDRSAPVNLTKPSSASANFAPASFEPAKSVPFRLAFANTAPVRSSLPSISCGLWQPVQSTRAFGASWQLAIAGVVKARRRPPTARPLQRRIANPWKSHSFDIGELSRSRRPDPALHRLPSARPLRPEHGVDDPHVGDRIPERHLRPAAAPRMRRERVAPCSVYWFTAETRSPRRPSRGRRGGVDRDAGRAVVRRVDRHMLTGIGGALFGT